ncbi:AAEL004627-PA [Aedes aegypti]|uniref:AAEL004627-PA n=1 Tax=Aedes aegypti TaxID=7159 RepID=Q17CB8_AEDAE|nr:AAEL004627-PA [Aedes aegypti]
MMIEVCSDEATRDDDEDSEEEPLRIGGRSSSAVVSLRMAGFLFPLQLEEDIERLEAMVRKDLTVREQYIRFVGATRVGDPRNIVTCIKRFFTDKSLVNYTYNGVSNPQYPRKAMKEYDIFTTCLLVAWEEDGITADVLRKWLIKATQRAKQHLSSARYYQRYREQLLDKRKSKWRNKRTSTE